MRAQALTTLLAAGALLVPATHAGAAGGGSIVVGKGGDVWRISPDGKRKQRLTRATGGRFYSSASQDDAGRIVAVLGKARVWVRLSPRGRRRGKPQPTAGFGLPLAFDQVRQRNGFVGPMDAQVSPDGKLVGSWGILEYARAYNPNAIPPEPMFILDQTAGTVLEHVGSDDAANPSGHLFDMAYPSWYGGGNVLFSPVDGTVRQYGLWFLAAGQLDAPPQPWFGVAATYFPFEHPEITRAGDKLALVTDRREPPGRTRSDSDEFGFMRLAGPPPALPTTVCSGVPNPDGKIAGVSWSPDGTRIAWADRRGVWTGRPVIPQAAGIDVPCSLADRRLIFKRAIEPDWGPALLRRRR